MPSISAQLPQPFDLLWFKPFENTVLGPQPQGDKIPDFQTPPAPPLDELSDPNLTPSPNASRDKILPQGKPSLLIYYVVRNPLIEARLCPSSQTLKKCIDWQAKEKH